MRSHAAGVDGANDEVDMFDDTALDLTGGQALGLEDEAPPDDPTDLVWWLAQLALHDRDRYRRIREIAWILVAENTERSVIPN
jgi:hypothetical protein